MPREARWMDRSQMQWSWNLCCSGVMESAATVLPFPALKLKQQRIFRMTCCLVDTQLGYRWPHDDDNQVFVKHQIKKNLGFSEIWCYFHRGSTNSNIVQPNKAFWRLTCEIRKLNEVKDRQVTVLFWSSLAKLTTASFKQSTLRHHSYNSIAFNWIPTRAGI